MLNLFDINPLIFLIIFSVLTELVITSLNFHPDIKLSIVIFVAIFALSYAPTLYQDWLYKNSYGKSYLRHTTIDVAENINGPFTQIPVTVKVVNTKFNTGLTTDPVHVYKREYYLETVTFKGKTIFQPSVTNICSLSSKDIMVIDASRDNAPCQYLKYMSPNDLKSKNYYIKFSGNIDDCSLLNCP